MTDAPRPLPFHLASVGALWGSAPGAAPLFAAGMLPVHPDLSDRADALQQKITALDEHEKLDFLTSVSAQAVDRTSTYLKGLHRYCTHPFRRPPPAATVCYSVGTMELLDYGGGGTPILLVPSLINPCYVLDLMQGRSMVAYLKRRGFRVFLVNWNDPGDAEMNFGLDGYVVDRLMPALAHVSTLAGGHAVPVVGYCMGGTLSVALASRVQDSVACLALLAAPWDFGGSTHIAGKNLVPMIHALLAAKTDKLPIPVDMLQMFFTSLDTTLHERKFRRFANMDLSDEKADFFVALEEWSNSGAPLASRAAKQCLQAWYTDNLPVKKRWMIQGAPVDPADITCPVFVAAPAQDRLVPRQSALAVMKDMASAVEIDPGAGHVGMVVGSRAEEGLWQPLASWLQEKNGSRN